MTRKNIIFDLDQTLVDTSVLESYRCTRNWKSAYNNIPQCRIYSGMVEVFQYIRDNSIKVCIVSSSPKSYVERIVNHFNIPVDYIVGYHDTHYKKPHPEPMEKSIALLNCEHTSVISFGDRAIDILAARNIGIKAIGCAWDTREEILLKNSKPDAIIHSPSEIVDLLTKHTI